jgi:hypothetical protein
LSQFSHHTFDNNKSLPWSISRIDGSPESGDNSTRAKAPALDTISACYQKQVSINRLKTQLSTSPWI